MIYSVRHATTYRYPDPVTLSSHRLRLRPRATPRQTVRRFALEIAPQGHALVAERDAFGNPCHLLEIRESHAVLSIEARSVVEVQAEEAELGFTPWEAAAACARAPADPKALEAAEFAFPSPFTAADDRIEALARGAFAPGRPVLEAARDLTARIHHGFAYDPEATHAGTTAVESAEAARGVCQDFAHVFLAGCRALGVPARYVSGYLLTRPPEGQEKLVGADASHAWVSVWCPVAGWVDFDPTNDCIPGLEHVTCAWGRDYADVGPVSGVVLGGAGHSLSIAVDVVPLTETAAAL